MSGKDDLANLRCFPGHEYAFFTQQREHQMAAESPSWQWELFPPCLQPLACQDNLGSCPFHCNVKN